MIRLLGVTCGGDDLVDRIEAALRAGVDAVIVREAQPPAGLSKLTPYGARVLMHARMTDADAVAGSLGFGLHLPGHADVRAARRHWAGRLSRSTHSAAEASRALDDGADLVLLSPVRRSASKPDDTRAPLGFDVFAPLRGRPVLALGGMRPEDLAVARRAGAAGIAAMGGLFGPEAALPAYCAAKTNSESS